MVQVMISSWIWIKVSWLARKDNKMVWFESKKQVDKNKVLGMFELGAWSCYKIMIR
jgi:hypothetical protein